MLEWNGRLGRFFEPLSVIAADNLVTCAAYAKQHHLLAVEGWHRFRYLAKKD